MKKTIIVLTALTLCACSGSRDNNEPDKLPADLSACIELQNGVCADVLRSEDGSWDYTLTSPDTAAGAGISYLSDGICVISVGEHSTVYDREKLPQYGVLELTAAALDSCINDKGVTASAAEGTTTRTGSVRGVSFTLTSGQGSPIQLTLSTGETVTFKQPTGETE
ncbi:MAG: hypothetical protein IJ561_03825 [Ruminococcus sp.]|nr:hypothetical protein [Ruminococcus sp.]